MGAMLGPPHADRRQLSDLATTEPTAPTARPTLLLIEPCSTVAALLRKVIDDLIDLIGGLELATGALVSGLPASRALLTFATHQFLGLRARLRPPLRPRLGWIHRWRPRARARVLAYLFLQSLQTILVLRKPVREINDELDTHLTPRVINRLRLRAIHTRKIRCTNKESLPLAPTADRLPKPSDLEGFRESG